MNHDDLNELGRLLASARTVVAMRAVHSGVTDDDVIGLRHDVDDNKDSLQTAVKIADWEADHGYRSTFFMLHTASYWNQPAFPAALEQIAGHGHEIGIHANAITAALTDGGDPAWILTEAIEHLRGYGHQVVGVAPHGDPLCYATAPAGARLGFVNDEIFTECPRPELGAADRTIFHEGRDVKLEPRPLADFGLDYETYRLPHGRYLSDSGGHWNITLAEAAEGAGQLHILWHPDWWAAAFERDEV